MKTAQELGQDLLDAVELTERWKALGEGRKVEFRVFTGATDPDGVRVEYYTCLVGEQFDDSAYGYTFLEAARNAVAQTEDRGKLL